jgi:hypothetical protein
MQIGRIVLCNGAMLRTAMKAEGLMAKKSKRRAWTKEDVRTLKTLARQKTPAAKIARTLKRTEGATRQRASSLGISLETRG